MGAETKIAWCDRTFQPWIGCQRVSPGCQHCYAEAFDKRVGGATISETSAGVTMTHKALRWGPTAPRTRTSAAYWRQPLAWDKAAAQAGVRSRVFCASLADVFEARLELVEWRTQLLDLIARTPHLDWLLLTKRPENVAALLRQSLMVLEGTTAGTFTDAAIMLRLWLDGVGTDDGKPHPPANVWLGTTVEDQKRANERIPALLSVPARVRFLSCEPLLEPVALPMFCLCGCGKTVEAALAEPSPLNREQREASMRTGLGIDWLIIGGESGPKARPFNVAWARALVRQGRSAGAKVFVKQLGSNVRTRNDDNLIGDFEEGGWFLNAPQIEENVNGYREGHQGAEVRVRLVARAGEDPAEWPEDLRVREFPESK